MTLEDLMDLSAGDDQLDLDVKRAEAEEATGF